MTHTQQTTREVLEQAYARALKLHNDHWMHWSDDDIANSNENLSLFRAMLAHHTPSTTGEALVKLIQTAEELGAPQVEPAPKRCGLCGDCDAKAQKACTVPACFARDDYKPAPSTAVEAINTPLPFDVRIGDSSFTDGAPLGSLVSHARMLDQQVKELAALLPVKPAQGERAEVATELLELVDLHAHARDVVERAAALLSAPALPVGELTLEQITRIYDRYGGDMVNCTRAIERELAAARSQPTTEESLVVAGAQPVREPELEHVNCDDCTYHYKDADQNPCNTCIHSGDFGSNFEPRHGITQGGKV